MSSVLFVSHDADLCAVAARVLAKAGCGVTTALHAGHASLACMYANTFDVLIIENQMAEGPGLAIAERLRRYCPDLQVVRMCDAGAAISDEGIALSRPFTADDLIQAMVDAADLAQARRGATSR
jgi:DNA-binding NtrC family response regulator